VVDQSEILFEFSSVSIALALFVAILVCNEFSYRLGVMIQSRTDDEVKALTGAVQASILGLLALLLGFTFNMSMQRFDNRSMAVIDEANAIGTAWLRADLLPAEQRDKVKSLMADYVRARTDVAAMDLTQRQARRDHLALTAEIQSGLWDLAVAATDIDPRPVTTGSFVNALNQLIDSQGRRSAILQAHVPEPILLLLFFVFVASIGIMGYSSGLSGRRILVPLVLVSLLITLIVFIIVDLDRPKRGLIKVDQSALIELTGHVSR
tara:strand:+ start:1722 stop:2516 length:795 start_codon:yes stop_codon:yes gene_type:complete